MASRLRVFLPKPPWASTRSTYEGFARSGDIRFLAGRDQHFQRTAEIFDVILERLPLRPSDRLLDIGCGDGSLLLRVCNRVSTATGTVLTETERDRLRDYYKGYPIAFHAVRLGDKSELAGEYDVVVANSVLFVMGGEVAAVRALRAIADALRPGGLAWIGEIPSRPLVWPVFESPLGALRHVWRQRGRDFALKYARHLLRRFGRRAVFVARERIVWWATPERFRSLAQAAGFRLSDQWSCFEMTGDEFYNLQKRISYLLIKQ